MLGVIVGALLSIFGSWLSTRSSAKQLKVQLEFEKSETERRVRRERLEELYVLLGNWLSGLFGHSMTLILVMRGQIDYNQYLDQVIEMGRKRKHDFNRLEMIIDIYAQSLKPSYQRILEARETLNDIADEHKRSYKAGDFDGERFLKPYSEALLLIDELTERFRMEVAQLAAYA